MSLIKEYFNTISIMVGVVIALIAWLIPDIADTTKHIIAALALVLPAILVFIKWIFRIKKKTEVLEEENKRLRNSNAQWKRDFKRIEYENQLLLEYKTFWGLLLQMATERSKETKLNILLGSNSKLNQDIDAKILNYKNQEEVINER